MGIKSYFLLTLMVMIWGSHFVVAKWGLGEFPPILYTAMRFFLVALLIVPFRPLPLAAIKPMMVITVFGGITGLGFLFLGLSMTEASTSALIAQLVIPFSVVIGIVILKEKAGYQRLAGTALAFAGIILVIGAPGGGQFWGIVLLIISALSIAFNNIFLKKMQGISPVTMSGWISLFALAPLLFFSAIFEENHITHIATASLSAWGALVFSALAVSLVANVIMVYLIQKHDISHIMPLTLFTPVISFVLAVFFLGESITLYKVCGGLLVLAGVGIIEVKFFKTSQALNKADIPPIEGENLAVPQSSVLQDRNEKEVMP